MCPNDLLNVLINGSMNRTFRPTRGLRQGDPISSFLFLICTEGLSGLLNRGIASQSFSGLRINKHCPVISHLFFANDNLLFFKVSISDSRVVKDILNTYSWASGQVINFDNSFLLQVRALMFSSTRIVI